MNFNSMPDPPLKKYVTKSRMSIMGEAAIDSFLLAVVRILNFI